MHARALSRRRSMEPPRQPAPERPRVPPGFHFTPSPEELIHSYLNPWIAGEPLGELAGVVCVADVYGCDPATLTGRFREFGHDGHWYFLCVARWKKGTRGGAAAATSARGRTAVMSRVVKGGGTWHCTQRKVAGVGGCGRQSFEYRDAGDRKTSWLMEEFSSDMEEAADGAGVKVICKVYLSPRAPPLPAPVKEERHETKLAVGSKRPTALLHREDVDSVAPAPAPAKINRAAEAESSDTAAGTSQDTAPAAAWLQPMLEGMSRPVCYHGGVFIKMEEPEPLAMVRADGEVVQFAKADDGAGNGIAIDVRKQDEAAANEWVDRVLNFN